MATPSLPDCLAVRHPLLDLAAREIAPTSLEQFDRLKKHLPLVDLLMVAHVDDYCRATGYLNVTGRELADWLRRDVLSVRPRLSAGRKAGLLEMSGRRASRHPSEAPCAPYHCVIPRAALERAIKSCHGYAPAVPREAVERVAKHVYKLEDSAC